MDSFPFNLEFHEEYIWKSWSMLFHSSKELLMAFAILFKIHSTYCVNIKTDSWKKCTNNEKSFFLSAKFCSNQHNVTLVTLLKFDNEKLGQNKMIPYFVFLTLCIFYESVCTWEIFRKGRRPYVLLFLNVSKIINCSLKCTM